MVNTLKEKLQEKAEKAYEKAKIEYSKHPLRTSYKNLFIPGSDADFCYANTLIGGKIENIHEKDEKWLNKKCAIVYLMYKIIWLGTISSLAYSKIKDGIEALVK
jgi:hypothetical protein